MPETVSATRRYYYGFDYLRAVMALAVVAWHIHLFGISSLFDQRAISPHALTISNIVNFQFLLLAVPFFFLISLFLFFDHYHKTHGHYFNNRIKKIACLYGFWLGLFFLFYGRRCGLSPLLPVDGKDLIIKIVSGWSTLYYFFFSLLVMTCLARIVVSLPRQVVWMLCILSLSSLWGIVFLVKIGVAPNCLVAYWNPLNFLPYVFIARLFSGISDQDLSTFSLLPVFLLLLGVVLAAGFEWQWMISSQNFPYNDCAFPAYTRVSLALGAILVFRLSWFIRRRPHRLIRFLSDYSLGLYCLHGYVSLLIYERIVSTRGGQGAPLIAFLLIVSLSLAAAVVLRRLLGRQLI